MESSTSGEQANHDHLIKAEAHIWNHMFNFMSSMSLNCALQLGIPDVINSHGGPMTLSELVDALPVNKAKGHGVYRLMRILVHSGFFHKQAIVSKNGDNNREEEEDEEGYLLAPSSRFLLKDEPLSLREFYLGILLPVNVNTWYHVAEWFQNDDSTPFVTTHGREFWDFLPNDPKLFSIFNNAMASDARFATNLVIKECKDLFNGVNSLVDVGGGTGTMGRAIASAFPHLQCIVFDLPRVVANMEGTKNLSYVGGSMLEAIPTADAILLKWILHNWNDEECIKILKLCKQAIPSKENGGKVIIIDMVVDEQEKGFETQLFLDLQMMVSNTGKERTKKEWIFLFEGSGFSDYKINHVLGLRSIIEIYP